jgi:hypothetical protein
MLYFQLYFLNGEKRMRMRTLLLLLVLCCWFQTAFANESNDADFYLIVVESTPTHLFEKGQILKGEESIKLSFGQSVKLITPDGLVFTLRGNESGMPTRQIDDSENALVDALKLLSDFPYHRVRAGEEPPEVWMANIDRHGNYCALGNLITLWRTNAERASTLVIEAREPRGDIHKIKWAAGVDRYPFVFQEGTTYRIYFTNRPRRKKMLTFYQLPANIKSIHQRVRWMAKKGCVQQATRCFPYNKSECQ